MSNDLINHKPWCAPTRCSRDRDHVPPMFVEHQSAPGTVETDDADITTNRVELLALDGHVDFDLIHLTVNMTAAEGTAEAFLSATQAVELAVQLSDLASLIPAQQDGVER